MTSTTPEGTVYTFSCEACPEGKRAMAVVLIPGQGKFDRHEHYRGDLLWEGETATLTVHTGVDREEALEMLAWAKDYLGGRAL